VNAKHAAQKLWWTRVYAKENPTGENQEAVMEASHAAERDAQIVESLAVDAAHKDKDVERQSSAMKHSYGTVQDDNTESAHMAVKDAQKEANKAQKQAAAQAANATGPVAKQLVAEAKLKSQNACGTEKEAKDTMEKAKAALDSAAGELKADQSEENMLKIQQRHKAFRKARSEHGEAKSKCEQLRRFAIQIEASANTEGTGGDANAADVVKATEVATAAASAVQKAKAEERKTVEEHLSKLKRRYSAAMDKAQQASNAADRTSTVVKRLTNMVAHHPSEANIVSLKKALGKKKINDQKMRDTDRQAKAAFNAQKAALEKALKNSASPKLKQEISTKLNEHNLAYVSALRMKLDEAQTRHEKAKARAAAKDTLDNKSAVEEAANKVSKLKSKIDDAESVVSAGPKDQGSPTRKTIQEVKSALEAAVSKKEQIKKLAMADPSNDNLDAFRAQIRKVHSLQTELMMATSQQNQMLNSKDDKKKDGKSKEADELGQGNMAGSLLSYYCTANKYQNLCKFYEGFEQSGWRDKEGRVSKHLLTKVAESRNNVDNIKNKLSHARDDVVETPSKQNKQQVKAISKQLASAMASHREAEKHVRDFMKHQTSLKTSGKKPNPKLTKQIGKLVGFYCTHKQYNKLCKFYKELSRQHGRAGTD